MKQKPRTFYLWSLFLIALLFVSCGASSASGESVSHAAVQTSGESVSRAAMPNAPAAAAQLSTSQKQAAQIGSPQYLVKTLTVTLGVKDTSQAADALQAWISATDPRSTSAGMSYQQADNNAYNITMSFSVQAALYPQIQHYLRDYASQQKGQLVGFQENVQDITNDYIDTQSRLKNLHSEQERLLTIMSQTQALGDVIVVEQRLADVEGQIEQIEAHNNDLNNQLQFYTVTINLQPLDTSVTPPTPVWSIGSIFHDAFAASLTLAQSLLTLLIWLLAFSFYIVPLLAIAWFAMRWRKHMSIFPSSTPKA